MEQIRSIRRHTGPPTPPCGQPSPSGHSCTLPARHLSSFHLACDPDGNELEEWRSANPKTDACSECGGRGLVAQSPGQPLDGYTECESCRPNP